MTLLQVGNGLKPKVFEHYKREVVHAYGVQHMVTFYRLECAGLLRLQQQASKTYSALRKLVLFIIDWCHICGRV